MVCAWQSFLNILPTWMRRDVDGLGQDNLQELRLRIHMPPVLITSQGTSYLERATSADDLNFCINTASRYSPWLASTAKYGYITAPGGHRIGLCGNAAGLAGSLTDISGLSSICLRVARDFPGIGRKLFDVSGSILIIGKPGYGKTTLLRDLIRQRSDKRCDSISVVDERGEVFPRVNGSFCFPPGRNTDVLSGCGKARGIEMVLRSMGPDTIAIDEITAEEDCHALFHAGWCGVNLLATAHAGSRADLLNRPIYRPIIDNHLFDTLVILNKDKSWRLERLNT